MTRYTEILNKLSIEEKIKIVEEGTLDVVPSDALIRTVASELFDCDIDKTNIMQFQYIIVMVAPMLTYELKKRL